jgi:hypothetical protein
MSNRLLFRVVSGFLLVGVAAGCGKVEERDGEARSSQGSSESTIGIRTATDQTTSSVTVGVMSPDLKIPGLRNQEPISAETVSLHCCMTEARVFQSADGSRLRLIDEKIEGNPSEGDSKPLVQRIDEENLLLQLRLGSAELVTVALYSPKSDGQAVLESLRIAQQIGLPQILESIASGGFVELDAKGAAFSDRTFIQLQYPNPSGGDDSVTFRVTPARSGDLLEVVSEQPLAPIEITDGRRFVRQNAASGVLASVSWIEDGWLLSISAASDVTVDQALESASTDSGMNLDSIREQVVALLRDRELIDSTVGGERLFELRSSLDASGLPVVCAKSETDLSCASSLQPPAVASLLLDERWIVIAYGASEKLQIDAGLTVERFTSPKGNELQVIDLGTSEKATLSITDVVLGSRELTLSRPIV